MKTIIIDGIEYNLTPKLPFKKGDWVVISTSSGEKVVQIDSIEHFKSGEPMYITSEGRWFGNGTKAHLWTIQDAKDGDVLASNRSIFIFSQEYIAGKPEAHCGIMNGLFLVKPEGCWTNEECYPATKEQRDTLFAKMKEAGYEWDADKKELKKIEQKSAENPTDVGHEYYSELLNNDDSDTIDEYAYQCAYCMSHDWMKETATWEDVQKAVKLGAEWNERHHNSSWSEEDAVNFNLVYTYVPDDSLRDWLKELKERYTWKPSAGQMKALHDLNLTGNISYAGQGQVLIELYNDLKKLTE